MFDRESIDRFWAYIQSTGSYAQEDRTNVFNEEIPWLVDLLDSSPEIQSLLSWGCADGAREPGGVLDKLCPKNRRFSVFWVEVTDKWFKDIKRNLNRYNSCLLELRLLLNPSMELSEWLGTQKGAFKILYIGVYDIDQFFRKDIGLEDYIKDLKQDKFFRGSFKFYFLVLNDDYIDIPEDIPQIQVTPYEAKSASASAIRHVRKQIENQVSALRSKYGNNFLGLLCVSHDEERNYAFQSTWYHREGIKRVMKMSDPSEAFQIELRTGTKGMALVVQNSASRASGAVVCLNNVLGCTFWEDQLPTIQTFSHLIS